MPDYSLDDAIYVLVIRSKAPKDGREVRLALQEFSDAGVEPVTTPHVVAFKGDECSSQKHDALRELGFTFEAANAHVPVVMAAGPSNDD